MRFPKLVFLAACLFQLACNGPASNGFAEGPGADLYSADMPAASRNLINYLNELCLQSGTAVPSGDGYVCAGESYPLLTQTGFNDIDRRCDHYLGWIDRKRTEKLAYKSGLGATQALVGGVLGTSGAAADTLAYVTQAFGFANTIYDAANTSMLMTLEASTIKTIVYERRLAFRKAAATLPISNRPAMIYVLRNYLAICTPQTILLDVNTFSRDAILGNPPDIEASTREQLSAVGPLTSTAPATSTGNLVNPPISLCPDRAKLFDNPVVFSCEQLKAAQTALCVSPDLKVGSSTMASLRMFESDATSNHDGLLSFDEFGRLTGVGCKPEDLSSFRNYYERSALATDATRDPLIKALNAQFPNTGEVPVGALPSNAAFRAKLAEAAAAYASELISAPPNGQLTPELFQVISSHIGNGG